MKSITIPIPEGFQIDSLDKKTGEVKLIPAPKDIKERVKSFEDALALVGCSSDMKFFLDVETDDPDVLAAQAFAKAGIIARALNEGWEPDWSNSNEWKYYPWFDMRKSASGGFSYVGYDYWRATSAVGSRLCFKSRELAIYAGKTFTDIYETLCVIPKQQ